MKLYIVTRTDRVGYDEFDGLVIASEDEESAKDFHADWLRIDCWASKENLKAEYIGEAKEGTEYGCVFESFNAG